MMFTSLSILRDCVLVFLNVRVFFKLNKNSILVLRLDWSKNLAVFEGKHYFLWGGKMSGKKAWHFILFFLTGVFSFLLS